MLDHAAGHLGNAPYRIVAPAGINAFRQESQEDIFADAHGAVAC
jgi:hypothetical protein